MLFSVLLLLSVFDTLIVKIPLVRTETFSSTTDAAEISTRATSTSNSSNTQDQEQEWRPNESNQQIRQPEKVVSIDVSSLHKYRRDGIENLPEYDHRRRYFLDFPERYQYENELYHRDKSQNRKPYQYQPALQYQQQAYQNGYQQQHRNREETYPVTIQGCNHMMQGIPQLYAGVDTPFQNRGIFQSWPTGSGWHGNHATTGDDKRFQSSYPHPPLQVTTASPKIAPSYRNRDYARYDFNYHDKTSAYKPRYNSDADVSAYDPRFGDIKQNPTAWMQPYLPPPSPSHHQQRHQNRNNRIVYYEYNLDDRRPTSGGCHPTHPSCGSTHPYHENRWANDGSSSSRHASHFDGGYQPHSQDGYYYREQQQQQPYLPESAAKEDSGSQYLGDDAYRYQNKERGGGHYQNNGIGYVYSIDLPVDRAISPSTAYAYDMGFAKKNQGYRHASIPHPDT